jgi:sugar lactone lactonase YvrE
MKKITTILTLAFVMLSGVEATAQAKIYDFAGNNNLGNGYSGDGGLAVAAQMWGPSAIAFDASGNMYIADEQNGVIRMVNPSGIISTFAGNQGLGTGYSGDGGAATAAQLSSNINALVFDGAGNLYIGDFGNSTVRMVNASGIISSYYGGMTATIPNAAGISCTGLAWLGSISSFGGTPIGAQGCLFVATRSGPQSQIALMDLSSNSLVNFWGGPTSNNIGDGSVVSTSTGFNTPRGMAFDAAGNLYIADSDNNRIRVVNRSTGIITNFAGNSAGTGGVSGDGGQATAAKLSQPADICFDAAGNMYIADTYNNRIRKVNTAGVISTIVSTTGSSTTFGYNGDAITATTALLYSPQEVVCDASGNVYIADLNNNEVREVTSTCIPPTIVTQPRDTTVCAGTPAQFNINYINYTGYQWQVTVGTNYVNINQPIHGSGYSSDTITNPTIAMNNTVYQCIVKGCSNVTSTFGVLFVSAPTITFNTPSICAGSGGSAVLIASGADTYTWQPSLIQLSTLTVSPTGTSTYTVFGTDAATTCTASATGTVTILEPQIPSICMVTTDTSFTHNIVYWEHTLYSRVDSFIVYRYDVTSASYLRLGAVGKDSSQFTDIYPNIGGPNGGDPQITAWQYKMAIKDSCGNIGTQSPYHQTVNVQQNNQNITWNAYAIEGESNPVSGYQVLRDSLGIGNWHVFVNTSGLSTNDPNYALYPNANYLVNAEGFTCNPALRLANGNNSTFAAKVVSHSNSNNNRETTSIKKLAGSSQVNIYPNPTNGTFVIEPNDITNQIIQMYDVNGKLVLSQSINGKTNIDASGLNEGVYNISIISNNGIVNKRLVIVR